MKIKTRKEMPLQIVHALVKQCAAYYACSEMRLLTLLRKGKKLILESGARLYLQNKPRAYILETTTADGIDCQESLHGNAYFVYIDNVLRKGFMRFFQAQNYMAGLCDIVDGASRIYTLDRRGVVCEEWINTCYGGWRGRKAKGY